MARIPPIEEESKATPAAPDHLTLDPHWAAVVAYGRAIVRDANNIPPGMFDAVAAFLSSDQIGLAA